jgi:hypothetical protein
MARYYSQNYTRNVTKRRNSVVILAVASVAAAISVFHYLAALVHAGAAAVGRHQSRLRERDLADEVRNREPASRQSSDLPRGVFDPLYSGLSADAARIDAALRRRSRLR